MLTVTVGRGRKRRTIRKPNLPAVALHYMTEKTQVDMFGEVVARRFDKSIHPNGRRKSKKSKAA